VGRWGRWGGGEVGEVGEVGVAWGGVGGPGGAPGGPGGPPGGAPPGTPPPPIDHFLRENKWETPGRVRAVVQGPRQTWVSGGFGVPPQKPGFWALLGPWGPWGPLGPPGHPRTPPNPASGPRLLPGTPPEHHRFPHPGTRSGGYSHPVSTCVKYNTQDWSMCGLVRAIVVRPGRSPAVHRFRSDVPVPRSGQVTTLWSV